MTALALPVESHTLLKVCYRFDIEPDAAFSYIAATRVPNPLGVTFETSPRFDARFLSKSPQPLLIPRGMGIVATLERHARVDAVIRDAIPSPTATTLAPFVALALTAKKPAAVTVRELSGVVGYVEDLYGHLQSVIMTRSGSRFRLDAVPFGGTRHPAHGVLWTE